MQTNDAVVESLIQRLVVSATNNRHRLHALPRERLIDRAVEAIKDYILANELASGDRLPSETQLAESLGVSRNVVRQAISSLEALGLVKVVHGRGTYVARQGDADVFRQLAAWINVSDLDNADYLEVRAIFERGIFETLIERATDADFDQIETIATNLTVATTPEEAQQLHDTFHQACLAATGNRFLMTIGAILYRFFWRVAACGSHVHQVELPYLQSSHLELVRLLRRRRREDIPTLIALHLGIQGHDHHLTQAAGASRGDATLG